MDLEIQSSTKLAGMSTNLAVRVTFQGRFRFEILAKRWRYKNSVGKLLESPENWIWGVVRGFRNLHHVNLHDLEILKMLLRMLESIVEVTSSARDEC